MRNLSLLILLTLAGCASSRPLASTIARQVEAETFTNPVFKQEAPDPFVAQHDGWYYLTATFEPTGGIWLLKGRSLLDIEQGGERAKVWTAPQAGPLSNGIWAPELYRFEVDGEPRWYLYFCADDGEDRNHRMYVMVSAADDPMGEWSAPERIDPSNEEFAIDGSVLTLPDGRQYLMYANGGLWIVPMPTPTTVDSGRRVKMAEPTLAWERHWIEAPVALVRDGRVMVAYSAGHTALPHYAIGLLTLRAGGDPLEPGDWEKDPSALLYPQFNAYGANYSTGHNGFAASPDGTETWIVYHGKTWAEFGENGFANRQMYMQRLDFDADGRPVAAPAKVWGEPVPVPSGDASPSGDAGRK